MVELESVKDESPLSRSLQTEHYNGAVAVVTADKELAADSQGFAHIDMKVPFASHTLSGAGTVTQQFFGVLLMQFVEKGALKLTDKLSQYVPEYKQADKITIGQLATMQSGIPDYLSSWLNHSRRTLRQPYQVSAWPYKSTNTMPRTWIWPKSWMSLMINR